MSSKGPRLVVDVLSIVLPGGVALWILGRTLAVYWGRDTIASTILIAMAVSLLSGLLELALRVRRATQLESEVSALPPGPSEATVDGASPLLSSLLRGRIEQGAPLSLGDSVAPYLTGLLVMLGLLGTLLGLFETIHGAGDALTTSADVAALRRSLVTPIDGLRRSFGCSAAGISASALLGLAVALVRRREGRALRAIHAYAAGPLRVLSPARRQARAVEQLVAQGALLPDSARTLEQVGAQLEVLSERLVGLQESALEGQKLALSALLEGVRSELAKVATDTGAALSERVSPIVAQLVERTGETAREQASALSTTALELTRSLERDREARRDAEQARELSLSQRLDDAERARAAAHAAELETLTSLAQRTIHDSERRESALAARWETLSTQLESALRSVHDDDARRQAELEALAGRMGDSLGALTAQLDTQLARRLESEQAHEARAQSAMAQLAETAARVEEHSAHTGTALETLVARLPPLFSEVAAATQASANEAIEQLRARAEEAEVAAHAQLEALVARTEAQLTALVERFDGERAERTERECAHDERAQRTTDRLAEAAGAVESMIAGQREGLEALVTRVGALFEQLAAASRAGAEQTLARLSESADRQIERFAALEQKLGEARNEQALAVGQALTTQSEQLEQKLAQAFGAVQEAAATWQASSVEMQAIADSFARSIERQRELSDTFIESLGDVEGAVERAGRHAAADALSDQLASTQEVFARQLQFQRELFEQLRTLRGGGHRAHGEHDVSV